MTQVDQGGFPVIKLCSLQEGVINRVSPLEACWARTNHSAFSAGYLLKHDAAAILYSGDTTTTDKLWQMAKDEEKLQAVFVETSFPDRLDALAVETGHLTPSLLASELVKLDKSQVAVKIFHMKPQYLQEIRSDLEAQQIFCQILNGNEQFTLPSKLYDSEVSYGLV